MAKTNGGRANSDFRRRHRRAAAAYALARKGFPVRVFEQSPEFREVGAGIQLGPNIFRVLEKIGLKDAILADAHRPPAQEMRDALTGKLITHIPLDDDVLQAVRPALCGDPPRRHPRHVPEGLPGQQPDHAGEQPPRRRLRGARRRRHASRCNNGERVAGPRADRLRRHVVEDPRAASSATASRASPATSPIAPCSSARRCRRICGGPTSCCGPARAPISCIIRCGAANSTTSSPCSIPTVTRKAGTPKAARTCCGSISRGQRPEVLRMLERIETWRMWVLCDREPVKDWSKGRVTLLGDAAHPMLQYLAQGACMATEDAVVLAEKVAEQPDDPAARFQGLSAGALSAHGARADHGARLWRVLSRARRRRGAARHGAVAAHAGGKL